MKKLRDICVSAVTMNLIYRFLSDHEMRVSGSVGALPGALQESVLRSVLFQNFVNCLTRVSI